MSTTANQTPAHLPWALAGIRKATESQTLPLATLTVMSVVMGAIAIHKPTLMPYSSFVVVLMAGGFVLQLRSLIVLYLLVTSVLFFVGVNRAVPPTWGHVVVIVASAALVYLFARSRTEVGVQNTVGDTMIVDLRDRLRAQGRVPELPTGWNIESVMSSAYGDSFSGDFLVASSSGEDGIEIALVDVSGKGQAAGTRALLLSGAFGGLIGALDNEAFLPAANSYLMRQNWDEGFATAVHLYVDFKTGDFRLAAAGHPPVARLRGGSGKWDVLEAEFGPALGLLDDIDFPCIEGNFDRGDALLLYTDGLVETPGRDIALGIDRLMGQAERAISQGGFEGGALRIMDGIRVGEGDDRALVMLWRS